MLLPNLLLLCVAALAAAAAPEQFDANDASADAAVDSTPDAAAVPTVAIVAGITDVLVNCDAAAASAAPGAALRESLWGEKFAGADVDMQSSGTDGNPS